MFLLSLPQPPIVAVTAGPLVLASVVERLLFENPWPLIGGVILAGAIAIAVFNRRGATRPAVAVIASTVVFAAGVWLLARMVTTDRERIRDQTLALVDAVAKVDEPVLASLLADDLSLYLKVGSAATENSLDRAATIDRARRTLGGPYRLKEWHVSDQDIVVSLPNATSTLNVVVIPEAAGLPVHSAWRVDWRRMPDGSWRAFAIELISMSGYGIGADGS